MHDNATAIYCFLDDYLKAIKHTEPKRNMNDSEVMLAALLASLHFGGNYSLCLNFLSGSGLCRNVLSRSRFSRRLKAVEPMLEIIFQNVGQTLKEFNTSMEYVMDSFPVKTCHNIRITNNRLLPLDEEYRGKCVSKREYFYGFRVHVIATVDGIPVEFAIVPGRCADSLAMNALQMDLPNGSRNISDNGFTNYTFEDILREAGIWHDSARRKGLKRIDPPYRAFYKNLRRKRIETVFSIVTGLMNKTIHATNISGFLLKVKLFLWSYTLKRVI